MEYPARIETARLYSRALDQDDVAEWARFLAHPVATQYFPKVEETPWERSQQWIDRQLGRYRESQTGLMALMHQDSQKWIGQCGLLAQEIDGANELEVGYHVFPEHWLQGYAIEAARAFRDYGFQNCDTPSIISIIHRDNVGSQAVATRNGMQREKACDFKGLDVYVYRIWREEWMQMQLPK